MKNKLEKYVVWHPMLGYTFKQARSFNWSDVPETRGMFTRYKDAENFIKKLSNSGIINEKVGEYIEQFEIIKIEIRWRVLND